MIDDRCEQPSHYGCACDECKGCNVLRDRLWEARELLARCRPHIQMSRSITSGRDFKEGVDDLLSGMDQHLAAHPTDETGATTNQKDNDK